MLCGQSEPVGPSFSSPSVASMRLYHPLCLWKIGKAKLEGSQSVEDSMQIPSTAEKKKKSPVEMLALSRCSIPCHILREHWPGTLAGQTPFPEAPEVLSRGPFPFSEAWNRDDSNDTHVHLQFTKFYLMHSLC